MFPCNHASSLQFYKTKCPIFGHSVSQIILSFQLCDLLKSHTLLHSTLLFLRRQKPSKMVCTVVNISSHAWGGQFDIYWLWKNLLSWHILHFSLSPFGQTLSTHWKARTNYFCIQIQPEPIDYRPRVWLRVNRFRKVYYEPTLRALRIMTVNSPLTKMVHY